MKILLTQGAEGATADTIVVLPMALGRTFETLTGDPVDNGFVGEADADTVTEALRAALTTRRDEFISAKDVLKDLRWLSKALVDCTLGSKVGMAVTPAGFKLNFSEATRIDRAENLAVGDPIAVGPNISPKAWMNVHGRVTAIRGDRVVVDLDPGDRDRLQRAIAKRVAAQATLPISSVEKVR